MAKSLIDSTPGATTPDEFRELFGTDEILHFNDGRWGLAGYGMWNAQGKTWTNNSTIYKCVKLLGATMFDLAHRQDVKFPHPPHKQFWFDYQLAILHAKRMLRARRVDPGTTRQLEERHVTANPRTFLVYPVPFFAGRVRQEDVLEQIELGLRLLGEMAQHSSNERAYYIDGDFVDVAESYLVEMLGLVAVNYFGFAREEAMQADFEIPAASFAADAYQPENNRPSVERSTERPSRQWWPTENDLSAIKGIAYTDALAFADRWPISYIDGEGDWESTLPGIENRVQSGDTGLLARSGRTRTTTRSGRAP